MCLVCKHAQSPNSPLMDTQESSPLMSPRPLFDLSIEACLIYILHRGFRADFYYKRFALFATFLTAEWGRSELFAYRRRGTASYQGSETFYQKLYFELVRVRTNRESGLNQDHERTWSRVNKQKKSNNTARERAWSERGFN